MKTYDILNAGPRNRFTANGRVVSNSGRAIQLQNLVRNELSTLSESRDLIKMGCFDMVALLYGNVPDVLSQLIRTMLIPKPGCKFIVADFSAIEARVLAWLAGEQWRLDAFKRGEDIYCASASAMFGVPVVKHGINGELRQKGKIAELACIAEGQLVLTDKGLFPIENVTTVMKIWDGKEWVNHDGVVYRGEREVITYEGLTATTDHLVFIEGQSRPIRFDFAASIGAHLVQTGYGRHTIRLGKNHQSGKTMESSNESMLRFNRMSRMWLNSMAKSIQSKIRKIEGLPKLHAAKANSVLVRSKTYSRQTTMRKSERSGILKLWCERNKVRISKCNRSWTLFNSKFRDTEQSFRNRPYRQQRKLRTWKYSLRDKERELCKQTNNCFKSIQSRALAIFRSSRKEKTLGGFEQRRDYPRCENCCIRETKKLAWNTRTVKVYDILNAGRHHRFTVSGKLVHNCGYQGGTGALTAMGALDMGLKEDDLPKLIEDWRTANPNIVKFWYDLEKSAMDTINDHQDRTVGKIEIQYYANTLWLVLPSGRKLAYINPKLAPNRFGRMSLIYEGLNAANKWDHTESYGGKLAENITQSTARDLLAEAMWRMEQAGLDIVAHIHDEIVLEVPMNTISVDDVCKIMNQNPAWAEGLPLSSAGYSGNYYFKD